MATSTSLLAALPALSAKGTHFVDPAGQPVTLKGCNLGNWLILESWMFGDTLHVNGRPFKDQAALYATLEQRFGRGKSKALMDTFRGAYITTRDFELIQSFGFNVVRVPFDHRSLQDDNTTALRPDAFGWLDHTLKMAEQAGVYVILDLHGAPGGQSKQDHTGQSDQNRLWQDKAARDRTVVLWKAIAERYKDRPVIAAYDLINEPYGDFQQDVRPQLAELCPRIARAIRETGDEHVILYPGALNRGIGFYGNPNTNGLSGIGFTEHFYPGLFGSKPALETYARLIGAEWPAKRAQLERLNTPYLVGEFNPVLAAVSPNRMTRQVFDRFADYGWAGTLWSYKLLKTDGGAAPSAWYMATNASPLPTLDAANASYEQLTEAFAALATASIAVNEPLRKALTDKTPAPLPLAAYAGLPTAAPATPSVEPAGYTSLDIGQIPAGHTRATGDTVEITAAGHDIIGTADSFRFVFKPVAGTGGLRATFTAMADSHEYAKAGVMARWGDAPGAAMAMINVFPDGTIALVSRTTPNGPTTETITKAGVSLPVQLKLDVNAGRATASFRADRGAWQPAGVVDVPAGAFRLGLATCAHAEEVFTVVNATLDAAGDALLPAAGGGAKRPSDQSLLTNGSFEQQGAATDVAAGWNRWGDWINFENTWTPTHDGHGLIGYHHGQIEKPGSSGIWQDAKTHPGKRYTFTLFAQHDPADAGKQSAHTVELRLEGITPDGPVTLNSGHFFVKNLGSGKTWTRLSVSGTAVSDTTRVLAVITASDANNRGGAVKLDDATLTPAADGK